MRKKKTQLMSQADLYVSVLQYQEAEIHNLGDCLHVIPAYGRKHEVDSECWCQPEICVQSEYIPVILHLADQ